MNALHACAAEVLELAKARHVMLATAESCTGGLVAAHLTEIAGSSAVVDRSFVTYSNEAKAEMLGVPMAQIETQGAVSEPVARAMAEGALTHSRAALAVSITGVAGPGGGSEAKPVGLVWFAIAGRTRPTQALVRRFGDVGRSKVRELSVETALALFKRALG